MPIEPIYSKRRDPCSRDGPAERTDSGKLEQQRTYADLVSDVLVLRLERISQKNNNFRELLQRMNL